MKELRAKARKINQKCCFKRVQRYSPNNEVKITTKYKLRVGICNKEMKPWVKSTSKPKPNLPSCSISNIILHLMTKVFWTSSTA